LSVGEEWITREGEHVSELGVVGAQSCCDAGGDDAIKGDGGSVCEIEISGGEVAGGGESGVGFCEGAGV